MKYGHGLAALVVLGAGCGNNGEGNSPVPTGTGSASISDSTPTASGSATDTDTDTTPPTATNPSSTGSTGEPPSSCAELMCSGPGSCIIDDNGDAYCECDEGYVLDLPDNPTTCVVDETCFKVRFLEDRCRQVVNGEPAVALFFGVDFCAGTAATKEKLDELGIDILILENDVDVTENVESSVTFIDTSVENYVNLVIDVSESLTDDAEFFPELVTGLNALVDGLQPQGGDPDVYVGMYVFGRAVAEYLPFTRDFSEVRAALDTLLNDSETVVDLAGGGQGTDLFEATKEGIQNTQRIRELRDAVTWGGVLTTGTIVVITDGMDSSNGMLDTGLISDTRNHVISVGLGLDINDNQLRQIGRDGNFLAPTADDLADAFDAITTRVRQYPLRSQMLGYCSSTTEGNPTVTASLQGGTITSVSTATCTFSATLFSSEAVMCNEETFTLECGARECGGLTACGACPDDQCCTGAACADPVTANDSGVTCIGNPETCGQMNGVCDGAGVCQAAAPPGEDLGDTNCAPGCEPGAYMCNVVGTSSYCEPALSLGSGCVEPLDCQSLNCYFVDPDNPFDGRKCLPEARIADHCGPEDAICEDGSYCAGGTCKAKFVELVQCENHYECRRAQCTDFGTGNYCGGPAACYWAWDEKVPN